MNKRLFKKLVAMLLITVLAMTLFGACGKKSGDEGGDPTSAPTPTTAGTTDPTKAPDATPTPEPTQVPDMDLGGMEIIIGDWWSGDTNRPATYGSAYEEAVWEKRDADMKKYNYTIVKKTVGGWGDGIQQEFVNSTIAESPTASIFTLVNSYAKSPIEQGLCYDLSTLDNFDPNNPLYVPAVIGMGTYNGGIYTLAQDAGRFEPRAGVFFNKRILTEAGIDWNEIYDHQKNGTWTWDVFEGYLDKVTRDIDNDGVNDVWGLVNFAGDCFGTILISNDAKFVGKDENGKYYNGTTEPQFLEATQWMQSIVQKYNMPAPEGTEWDWPRIAFPQGNGAFQIGEEYMTTNGNIKDMVDDYGFVLMPKGPRATTYHTNVGGENLLVIPACFTKDEAEKILFAFNLWLSPPPGYEDGEDWKIQYYSRMRGDERAVDETLAQFYDPGVGVVDYVGWVTGLDTGVFVWDIWGGSASPAEKIEANRVAWDTMIAEENNK